MKVFICRFDGGTAVVSAFNRGHAVKLLGKRLREEKNIVLKKTDPVYEFSLGDKKGAVTFLMAKEGTDDGN